MNFTNHFAISHPISYFDGTQTSPKNIENNIVNLSGPTSAYSISFNGKRYYLFGDRHKSMTNLCSEPCDIKHNCYNITTYLSMIFEKAERSNELVDFFLEVPYVFKSLAFNQYESSAMVEYYRNIGNTGIISKIFNYFYSCFAKTSCKYSTTRFHYTDVRRVGAFFDIPFFEQHLYVRVMQSIEFLKYKNPLDPQYIKDTDVLLRYFLGTDLSLRLFRLYLESDNFIEDVNKLFAPVLSQISAGFTEIREKLYNPHLLVYNKDTKTTMHVIRKQFLKLEKEGQGQLANLIKEFLINSFEYVFDEAKPALNTWNHYMELYRLDQINTNDLLLLSKELFNYLTDLLRVLPLLYDAYILPRMFRNYGKTPSTKTIVYAGNFHILHYVRFFENYLNVKVNKYEPNGKILEKEFNVPVTRCIQINLSDFN